MDNEASVDGLPERRVHRLLCFLVVQSQGGDLGDMAKAGELFHRLLGAGGKPLQLLHHEIHHIISVTLRVDAIDLPSPGLRNRVKREQPLLGQLGQKLDRKEWIAAGLFVNQLRQRPRALEVTVYGTGGKPADIVEPEGRQHYLTHPRIRFLYRLQRSQKWVSGIDLVVPIGADQQQVPHLRVRDQMLDEVERGDIQPLQIIEEQRERMLPPGEHAKKAPEHQLKSVLRFSRRQVGDGRLFPDDELQFGNEVDDDLCVRAKRLCQGASPLLHFRFTLDEDLADQGLEGLRQRRVRYVALVLVELT